MNKAGCPYDNALMKRFYNILKNELIYPNHFYTESALDEVLSSMYLYGTTISVPIRIMVDRPLLKYEPQDNFSN